MASLLELFSELKEIRDSIVKLSKEKRCGNQGQNKFLKAHEVKKKFDSLFRKIIVIEVDAVDLKFAKSLSEQFSKLFDEIESLISLESKQNSKMAEFDLKTALSLFPVICQNENQMYHLIEGLEFYGNMLKKEDHETMISFVMKMRLSEEARYKLNQKYSTVSELVNDIRKYLISPKSDTSISAKLNNCRQGNRSIESFGNELEKLATQLTLAQAKGDESAYRLLKPINEKTAIKRFAEGLNTVRTGTIVAARNVETLRQAIVLAIEHEGSTIEPEDNNQVNYFGNNRKEKYFHNQTIDNQAKRYNNNNRQQYYYSQQGRARANSSSQQNHVTSSARGQVRSARNMQNKNVHLVQTEQNEVEDEHSREFFLDE